MKFSWSDLKELFYVVGSLAGLFALFRTVFESKYQRDLTKVDYIKSLVNEQALVNLESQVYSIRRIPRTQFDSFDKLAHELDTNQNVVRFTGPFSKYLTVELKSLIKAYHELRSFVQVNEWLPVDLKNDDGTVFEVWEFNKEAPAFTRETGYPKGYAEHLNEAAKKAVLMKKAFNRFQIVSELHLFEAPIAKYLLKKRFKSFNLL